MGWFSSTHQHAWLSFTPQSPLWDPSSLSNSHFSTFLHNLLPQNGYLHNLHCFTPITLQIIKLVSSLIISPKCLMSRSTTTFLLPNCQFVFLALLSLSAALDPDDYSLSWHYTIGFLPTFGISNHFFSVSITHPLRFPVFTYRCFPEVVLFLHFLPL